MTTRGAQAQTTGRADPRLDDPTFPRLHGRPARGWVNDPHGCIALDGRYHVFFQHNPDSPHHRSIKWGHISSTDLAHWHEEPIALVNRPGEPDEFGCWTGSVIDDHGTPTALYSAVADAGEQAVILAARSDRHLRHWRQDTLPACGRPRDPAVTHARDPFIFELDGRRYGIQGAGSYHEHGAARVLVYACDNLSAWTELGPLITSSEDPIAARIAPADLWECPNLVRIDNRWVLILSLWNIADGTITSEEVRYLVGDLQISDGRPRFRAVAGGSVDRGHCFYAPHVLRDHRRTLIWGWAKEYRRSQADIDAAGWAGALTFCRQLGLNGDRLTSEPVAELNTLHSRPLDVIPEKEFVASAFDIALSPGTGSASLWLNSPHSEQLVAEFEVPSSPASQPRILVDGPVIEVFDGSGVPFTTRAYPTIDSAWILRLEHATSLSAWTLGE